METFSCVETHVKKPHTQLTCVTCNLLAKTSELTCIYAVSTSTRMHATALGKAYNFTCRMQSNYLQSPGEFTRGMIVLPAIAGILPVIARISASNCGWFAAKLYVFCTQENAIFHASGGRCCLSSSCKITSKRRAMLKETYMRLQSFPVYSARGACHVDARVFTCLFI